MRFTALSLLIVILWPAIAQAQQPPCVMYRHGILDCRTSAQGVKVTLDNKLDGKSITVRTLGEKISAHRYVNINYIIGTTHSDEFEVGNGSISYTVTDGDDKYRFLNKSIKGTIKLAKYFTHGITPKDARVTIGAPGYKQENTHGAYVQDGFLVTPIAAQGLEGPALFFQQSYAYNPYDPTVPPHRQAGQPEPRDDLEEYFLD